MLDILTDFALASDEAGYAGIFMTEHHLSINNPFQNSIQYASYLAPQVRSAYLGMATVAPALHHPLRLVEQLNLLDRLTQGRLVVGLGSGHVSDEYRAFGRDPDDKAVLFDQTVDVMLRMWDFAAGDEVLEFETRAERGRLPRPVTPAPMRTPRPILARATLTPAKMVDTARRGWPLMVTFWSGEETVENLKPYLTALADADISPEQESIARDWTSIMKWVHVAETDEQARKEVGETVDRWVAGLSPADDPGAPEAGFAGRDASTDEHTKVWRQVIAGSPETVARELRAYEDAGIGNFMCSFLRDIEELEAVKRSFELFTREVKPRFS